MIIYSNILFTMLFWVVFLHFYHLLQ